MLRLRRILAAAISTLLSREVTMALFKKNNTIPEEPMDLESVMKKYDQESNVRIWEGKPRFAVNCVLASFSLF